MVDGDEKPWVPGLAPLQPCLGLHCDSVSPSVKWVWGCNHSPLLLCWSGGEDASRKNRPNDGDGPAQGPAQASALALEGPQLPQSQPHTLASQHAPDGPFTTKASLTATSYLVCPPSSHLITFYVIFKADTSEI